MRKKALFVGLMAILLSVLFLDVCSAESKPQYGGILKIAYKKGPPSLGYPPSIWGPTVWSVSPCIETLLRMDKMGNPRPFLVTTWKIAPDGKSITLTARKGVKFHDGTDFDAEAIKWNLDEMKSRKRFTLALVTSIDIVDKYTARLNLSQYTNALLSDLAFSTGTIASPTAITKNGAEWAKTHPVGTGPFKFKSFNRDVSIKYERFDDYWDKGKPYLDGIEIHYIADPMTAKAALETGDVDLLLGSASENPKTPYDLKAMGYKVTSILASVYSLSGDSKNPGSVYADKRVREAIDYAIDQEAIVNAVGYGFWTDAKQMAVSGNMGYDPDLAGRRYSPEKAKQLLAEAGYPTGFKTKIIAPILIVNKAAMVSIQGYLKEVGIDAKLELVDDGKWTSYKRKGWQDALVYLSVGVDPNYAQSLNRQLQISYSQYPKTLRPPGWGDMMNNALAASDSETHKVLTQKMVRVLHNEATATPIWAAPYFTAKRDYVHGDGQCEIQWMLWTPADAWISK